LIKKIDEPIQRTALREAYEEIGLDPNCVEIIGITPGTPDRTMRFLSCGVVGYLGEFEKLELKPNPDEVEAIFTVPIETLLSPAVFKQTYFRFGKSHQPTEFDYAMPVFLTKPNRVWGFTALYTNMVLSILTPEHIYFMVPNIETRLSKTFLRIFLEYSEDENVKLLRNDVIKSN